MEKIRPFEVVKAYDRDITGNVQSGRVQVLHQSHHRSIVPRENCSGRTLQSQEPVKRLRVLASVMNQCFVDRKTMTLKSLLIGIHPLERGRHMRPAGNHSDSPVTEVVEVFDQLLHGALVLDPNLAESTG